VNCPKEILIQARNRRAFAGLLKPFFPSWSGGENGFNLDRTFSNLSRSAGILPAKIARAI